MTNDILARIDAARRSDSPHDMRMALYAAGAEIARLSALIPEPPADDEREAEEAAFKTHEAPSWNDDPIGRDAALRWHLRGFTAGAEFARNSPRDAPSNEREALIKIFAAGLRSPEWTKAVIAFKESLDGWRDHHRGPITDEEIERAADALYFEDCGERVSDEYRATPDFDATFRSYARVALEAARGAEGLR